MTYREFIEQLYIVRSENERSSGVSGAATSGTKSWQEQMNTLRFFSEVQKARVSRGGN